jgi:TolB-like protein/Tfp pilus assembly protein PilF
MGAFLPVPSDAENLSANGVPATIFLSYSRADQKAALPVIAALEAAGFSVWWDGLLEGGERFAKTTEAALENAKAVVVLWSKTSIASHWVHDEATRGRDRRCLVPLSIDGCEPPLGFRQFQVIHIAQGKGRTDTPEMQKMLRAVAALHEQDIQLPPPAQPPLITRRLALGGGAAIVLGGTGFAAWKLQLFGTASAQSSVAVLPFANLSGDKGQDYFSDGLSEEIRSTLSLNSQIEVAARTSSNRFKDQKLDATTIASQLGVAHIVDGAVRRAGEMVRVSVQLINGKTGKENWTQSFDRKMDDIFGVQSEIANVVADGLLAKMSANNAKTRTASLGGTSNGKAYDAFLRGKALYNLAADEKSDRRALAQFDEAIRLDPKYAAAYAAKSRVLTVIANNYASGAELRAYYDKSVAAARNAIQLVPELAEAQAALGFVMCNGQLDIKGAEDPYRKSFERGFGNADILSGFAIYAARTGKFDDARSAIARAQKLDPLNPIVFRNAGVVEYCDRQYDAAKAPLKTALSLNPKMGAVHQMMGDMALLRGDFTEAKAEYIAEPNALDRLKGLAIVEHRLKNKDAAQAAMAKLIAEFGDNSLYQQAQVLAGWGDKATALAALNKAYQAGDSGLVLLRNDPIFDGIRNDPGFGKLLAKLGFE